MDVGLVSESLIAPHQIGVVKSRVHDLDLGLQHFEVPTLLESGNLYRLDSHLVPILANPYLAVCATANLFPHTIVLAQLAIRHNKLISILV